MDGGHVALVPTLGMPQAPSKNYMGARSKKSCIGARSTQNSRSAPSSNKQRSYSVSLGIKSKQ